MKVTVIGFWGGFPAAEGATTGYLFEHDGFKLLVDCGSAVVSKLQNFVKLEELDAVIVSHYHHDHIADIGPLQYGRLITKMLGKDLPELPIYGHIEDQEGFTRLTHANITRAIAYNPNEALHIGPFSITFMKTKHPVTCYAMRFEAGGNSVVFTADTSYLAEFISFSQNADLLICECNLYANQDGSQAGHMTSREAGTLAEKAHVKKLMLTHLPHFGDHAQLFDEAKAEFSGDVELASTGLTWSSETR
ncbi:MBL fold metallo-hydrolase [Bacillus sp. HMF5848]|uniref:MBL fold metallo-hydrolase n=1 Tax=Bacillus sp. HMF5848 TaxID=2495421 RepID=UPI000F776965|nr:MBL fold metallo-hydrolase [Bacillus sp. HMF5848]RSK26341.1 MBL fold metallo-hydrolase [Bacillus sp. HMF5848]